MSQPNPLGCLHDLPDLPAAGQDTAPVGVGQPSAERSTTLPGAASPAPTPPPTVDLQLHQPNSSSNSHSQLSPPNRRLTPALQFRSRLVSHLLLERRHRLDLRRTTALFLQTILSISQFVGLVTILILSRHHSCDQPLRIYIIIHVIHLALSFPCAFYLTWAPHSRGLDQDESPGEDSEGAFNRPDYYIRIFHDFLCLTTILWFFLGNYFVFESATCSRTSKELFYTSVVILALGYLYIIEVICVIMAVMFCLPVVILGIQLFGWGEESDRIRPLKKSEIEQIPLVVYVPEGALEYGAVDEAKGDVKTGIAKKDHGPSLENQRSMRRGLTRLFVARTASRQDHSSGSISNIYAKAPYPVYSLGASQATCAICLADYCAPPRNPVESFHWEPLRKLPGCQHCFHQECIDPWLVTSARCPLCQAVVRSRRKSAAC